jgi:hypothetical protein
MLSAKSKAEIDAFFGFKPQPDTTEEANQESEARTVRERVIKAVSSGHSAPRELREALYDLPDEVIERALRRLVQRKAVRWNGQHGTASRYYRAA